VQPSVPSRPAGQATTVRLLGTALTRIGDRPDIQRKLRPQPAAELHQRLFAHREPGQGRLPVVTGADDRRRTAIGACCTVTVINVAANRDRRRFEDPDTLDPERKNARQHLAFGRGIRSCPGAPLARAETGVGLERLLDRTTDIRVTRAHHGLAGDRRYQYIPTYVLRGLTDLHLEFDLVEGDGR